jgi:hypothetical protein
MQGHVALGTKVVVVVVVLVVVVVEVVVVLVLLVEVVELVLDVDPFVKFAIVSLGPGVVVVLVVEVVVVHVSDVDVVVVTSFGGSVTLNMCSTSRQSLAKKKPLGPRRESTKEGLLGGKTAGLPRLK